MIKNILTRQDFSYSWVFERFLFCFIFEKTSSSLPMLFVHIEKSSSETLRSSRLQMFSKIVVLKNFSSLFLIKLGPWRLAFLLKKRFQQTCLPVNIAKFLRTAFLRNTFCSLCFDVMIEFFDTKLTCFHISCTIALFSFITLVLESGVHSYFVLVFIPKNLKV